MLNYILGTALLLKLSTQVRIFLIKKRAKKSQAKMMTGAEPFLYKKNKEGVLLIHGFSSTPDEMRGLGNYLKKENITCYCPLLSGHGTSAEKLLLPKWDDWINDVRKGLYVLDALCDSITIIGSSMGGNLAFLLAEDIKRKKINKKVKGLASLAAPFEIVKEKRGKLLFVLARQFKIFQKKKYSPEVSKKKILGARYLEVPLMSLKELLKVIHNSKKVLPKINKPTLLVQSKDDDFVSESSIEFVEQNLGSKDIETLWVNGYHVVLIDKDKNEVFNKINEFIHKR
jgi:carboxylesterase